MFKIGDFSKFSRVSVRMLRHYDQLGLLTPARVDPHSGYRFYTADQLPRLNRILALKDLGFPLEQIAELIEQPLSTDEMRGMLRVRQLELEEQLERDQARLTRIEARIEQIEREGDPPLYDVVVKEVPPISVASMRRKRGDDESLTKMFEDLEAYVARYKARAPEPPLTIYHEPEHQESGGELEVAVPIVGTMPEAERVQVGELPSVDEMTSVVHQGSYSRIQLASQALLTWIGNNGYRIAGPSREVYLRFGAAQRGYKLPSEYLARSSAQFVTELQIPVVSL
jgi:DNA-binding transcriptional MerR regulator